MVLVKRAPTFAEEPRVSSPPAGSGLRDAESLLTTRGRESGCTMLTILQVRNEIR